MKSITLLIFVVFLLALLINHYSKKIAGDLIPPKSIQTVITPVHYQGVNLFPYIISDDIIHLQDSLSFFGGSWKTFKVSSKAVINNLHIRNIMKKNKWVVGNIQKWKFPRKVTKISNSDLFFIKEIGPGKVIKQRVTIKDNKSSMIIYLEITE
jgi:hypothetical protein